MLAAAGQGLLLGAVGQKTVMANPHESVGKHMLKKSPDEFSGWQDRDLATIAVGPIAPVKTHVTALSREHGPLNPPRDEHAEHRAVFTSILHRRLGHNRL